MGIWGPLNTVIMTDLESSQVPPGLLGPSAAEERLLGQNSVYSVPGLHAASGLTVRGRERLSDGGSHRGPF